MSEKLAEGVAKGIAMVIALLAIQVTVGLLIVKYLGEAYALVEVPIFMIFMAVVLKVFFQKDISH